MPATTPDTRYAKSGEAHIAYQVLGDGPVDLVSGSGIEFEERGEHELKGVGARRIYAVAAA